MARQWGKYYSKSSKSTVEKLEATNQGYRDRINAAGLPGAEAPRPKRTVLETLGDWLSRADYAFGNVLNRVADRWKEETDKRGKLAGTLSFLLPTPKTASSYLGNTLSDAAKNAKGYVSDAVSGYTGKQKGDLKQAMTKFGFSTQPFRSRDDIVGKTIGKVPVIRNWSPAGSAGLYASILNPLDPGNYVGVGAAGDAAKAGAKGASKWGVKVGGKVVLETPALQKGLLSAGRYVRESMPIVSDIIQKVGPAVSTRFRPKGIDEATWDTWQGLLRKYYDKVDYSTRTALENSINRLARFKPDERRLILSGIEEPELLKGASKELVEAARLERRLLKAGGREEMAAGLLGTMRKRYVPHVQGTGKRIGTLGRTSLPLRPREGFAKQRTLEGTVRAINAGAGREVFDPDILNAVATREVSRQRAMKTQDFIGQVLGALGQKVGKGDMIPPGMGTYVAKRGKQEVTYMLPQQIADQLNRFVRVVPEDEVTKSIRQAWDKGTNLWKGYATAANLGFHIRNLLSNKYNRWLGDAFNLADDVSAIRAQLGKKGTVRLANGQTVGLDEVMRMAGERGVIDRGFFGADIPQTIREMVEDRSVKSWLNPNSLNPVSQRFIPLRLGRKVGNAVENTDRLAMFINQLRKTGDADSAARTVDKFLFNYNDMTPAMRQLRQVGFPFLTWQSKNIPLQFSQLIENPAKLNRTLKVIRAAKKESAPSDERYLPDYFRRLGAIPTGEKDAQGNPLYLNPNMPFQDLNKLDPGEFATQGLHPALKIPLELAQNRSWYFNRPIVEPGKEQTTFLNIPMSAKAAYVLQGFPFWGSMNKLIDKSKQKQKGMDAADLQALSWLGGIKAMPYDADKERTSQAYRERDRLQALIRALSDQGKLPEKVATPKGRRWGKHYKS